MSKKNQQQLSHYTPWFVLIMGLMLSYLSFLVAGKVEDRSIRAEQEEITHLAVGALNKELALSQSIISSIQRLFIASDHVSRLDFKLFTESELKAHPSIQALEWVPRVPHGLREFYRSQAVSEGLLDYDITERNTQNKMISAKPRDEYYPVYYIEPLDKNKTALGFDLSSSAERLVTLNQARLSRQAQATGSIFLVQDDGQHKGFLLVQPIFITATEGADKQKMVFNGFALGVFKVDDLVNSAIEPIRTLLEPLQVEITDVSDSLNSDLLYSSKLSSQNVPVTSSAWRLTSPIDFANRSWRFTTTATDEFISQHSSWTHWLILIIGCTLTLLASGYLRALVRRELVVQKLVTKRTEELQASEMMSHAIIDNAIDAVITIDELGAISLFSPAAESLFGYGRDEVVGKNVNMLMPDPYRSEHDGYLNHHKQTGEKRIIGIGREVKGQRKDGSTFPMNLSVGKTQINNKTLYIGTVTDLTTLKEKEQQVHNFSDRLDMAARAGRIGIWDYDLVNQTLEWDDRMFEIYGIEREPTLDLLNTWRNAVHPEDLILNDAAVASAIKGGKHIDVEYRIKWPDRQERFIQASGVVLFDENNYGYRMIGVNMDITERKRTEQAMLHAKQTAEEANRQKSAFLNMMSHELRTPLTVILGYLPLLKNKEKMLPSETIAKIAEDMDLSGQHLQEMINDLLDISKIEAGQMNVSIEEIECRPIIEEMLRKFENQAQQNGIELLSLADNFSFHADKRHLKQILINLIGNAIKFTPQGNIKISAKCDKKFVTFSIADTGIGIEKTELPFIFDTFRQVDDTSTRNTGGTGLGLAITKRLIELHGGSIKVDSEPGSGTTFTFTIKQ